MKNQIVRIIGGQWRSRKISFPSKIDHLRPTSDRIRETLFNWLQQEIINSHCLDAFAGSGALGLEALSRGAKSCTFIEKSKEAYIQLKKNLSILDAQNANVICGDTLKILNQLDAPFDIIFLDPPFSENLLAQLLELIHQKKLIKPNGLIYFELDAKSANPPLFNDHYQIIKQKQSGNVDYGLLVRLA